MSDLLAIGFTGGRETEQKDYKNVVGEFHEESQNRFVSNEYRINKSIRLPIDPGPLEADTVYHLQLHQRLVIH